MDIAAAGPQRHNARPASAGSMRVYLETFGCQMNELDSELVRGQLVSLGYRMVERDDDAEVVLYNTCSVRELAEQKALSRVGRIGVRKREGERLILGVLGCMAERDGVDMLRRHPQVGAISTHLPAKCNTFLPGNLGCGCDAVGGGRLHA